MGPAVGVGRGHAARSDGNEDATLSTRRSAQAGAGRAWIDRLFVREGRTQMGKLMKRAEKFARSPKAKPSKRKCYAKPRTLRPGKRFQSDSRSFARRPSLWYFVR
jgi:hypothetical protein